MPSLSTAYIRARTLLALAIGLGFATALLCTATARAATSATATTADAACPAVCGRCAPRPQDQVWLVSTRGLCGGNLAELAAKLKYCRLDAKTGWVDSNQAELLASDDADTVTTIFVHGNQVDACAARDWVGPTVYRALACQAPSERPLRFIIWSWPSDRIDGRLVDDVRAKAARTDTDGYLLARFLDDMDPRIQVSLMGYSFGARIVDGGLHLLGGGTLCGNRLGPRVHDRVAARTVQLAAAEDNDWLLPGHRFDKALPLVEKMLNVYNSCDMALTRYHLLYGRRCCQEALGCTGIAAPNLLGPQRKKIAQLDACCIVGKQHNWALYFESTSLVSKMAPYVFFAD